MGIAKPPIKELVVQTLSGQAETLADIGSEILCLGYPIIDIVVDLAGGSVIALDQFVMLIKHIKGGAFVSAEDTWTTTYPSRIMRATDLASLAHAASGHASIRIGQAYSVKFQSAFAGAVASAITVSLNGYLSRENG